MLLLPGVVIVDPGVGAVFGMLNGGRLLLSVLLVKLLITVLLQGIRLDLYGVDRVIGRVPGVVECLGVWGVGLAGSPFAVGVLVGPLECS